MSAAAKYRSVYGIDPVYKPGCAVISPGFEFANARYKTTRKGLEHMEHLQPVCYYDVATSFGSFRIVQAGNVLVRLAFLPPEKTIPPAGAICRSTSLLQAAALQLVQYGEGRRKTFDLPLAPSGTVFQEKVWQCLQQIPYGATISYQNLAEMAAAPLAYRAVGNANSRNPLPIFIPCHRVIGANGTLTGYAGGLALKKVLLCLEQKYL